MSSAGRVWGEDVTEKLVWHIVKAFATCIGVSKLAPISDEVALASAAPPAANWNRFSFSLATFRCRLRSFTWAAPSGFHRPSTTVSESSPKPECHLQKSSRRCGQR